MDHLFGSGFVLPRQVVRDPADWILVALALLVVLGTVGCADIRKLTMTKDELRLYGELEITDACGRNPEYVCIRE